MYKPTKDIPQQYAPEGWDPMIPYNEETAIAYSIANFCGPLPLPSYSTPKEILEFNTDIPF